MFASISVITKLNVLVGLVFVGMSAIAAYSLHALGDATAAAAVDRQLVTAVFILLIAVVTGLAIFVRLLVRQAMLRPIRAAATLVGRVALGDLTGAAGVVAHGETQRLLEALEAMVHDLRSLVGEVAGSARTVADTSDQIAHGNLDLSQRTEEQASTLAQTASSMEQLTATVAHNAQSARQASQLAEGASEVARKGGAVVGQVVATMTGISDSSRRIADIIGVIDGIAFQTNILALNAAVEAARAGDQGRGFAVVAAEVRSLAQRSATAAKEIKTLIVDSADKVDVGTRLVTAAGQTMQEIVSSVTQVTDLIGEIAAASNEQSSGIRQINTAVAQMDQMVQQNATLVEEATAATESMREQAAALLRMVSRFKLGEAAAPGRRGDGGGRDHEIAPRRAWNRVQPAALPLSRDVPRQLPGE
ncbi:methyl-accepting chemotaxis protein [Caenimonas terrae]|uniref:Methyl-accepting chemotaxis protein n=1 Tax=Caenimonas terrae TaxID=696074 RepID=A0ABW0NEX2_9BURK